MLVSGSALAQLFQSFWVAACASNDNAVKADKNAAAAKARGRSERASTTRIPLARAMAHDAKDALGPACKATDDL